MKKNLGLFLSLSLLISIAAMFFTASCKPPKDIISEKEIANDTVRIKTIVIDTIVDNTKVDSLSRCLAEARDSIKFYRDSIPYSDFINSRRIEKIRYYISICEKKPTNKKFFYGWIKRTMTE